MPTKKTAASVAAAQNQDKDKDMLNGSPPPPVNTGPMTAAQKQAAPYMAGLHDFELPKSVIQRLAKSALPDNFKMQQDVTPALLRSSTVFISYLTAAAHEVALARGAKSVTANDIMNATEMIEYGPPDEIRPILEKELAAFRAITASKKAARPSTGSTVGRRPSTGASLKGKGKPDVTDGDGGELEGEGEGEVEREVEEDDNEMAVDDEVEDEFEAEEDLDEPVGEFGAEEVDDVEMDGSRDPETNGVPA